MEIKERQVNINNWFLKEGKFLKVESHYDIADAPLFQGIPLTSEILDKAGFTCNKFFIYDTAFVLTPDWREQPSFHFGIEYTDSPFEIDQNRVYHFTHEVKYLHQLQNLIYINTGVELEIEL